MKTIICFFILSCVCFAQQAAIKFYLEDGTVKEYNISEIVNIRLTKNDNNIGLFVYHNNSNYRLFKLSNIIKINFLSDTSKQNIIHLFYKNTIIKYRITNIDSIVIKKMSLPIIDELKIGDQIWMAENLNVDHFRNGDSIPYGYDWNDWQELAYGGWCYYKNDPKNGELYGKLYNFAAIESYKQLAPQGWHIPSEAEWQVLIDYLGGELVAGCKLKSVGSLRDGDGLWYGTNEFVTDEYGFSAHPGGLMSATGTFCYLGEYGCWWSSSKWKSGNPISFYIGSSYCSINMATDYPYYGYSVRCIKD
jgi:uncharacterized protein (TIGR02145 family)